MPKRKSNQHMTRRRRRDSVMGKILPATEINTIHDFNDMNERLKLGPITIVFISADWCGHCQEFKKNWEEAVKSPNRSVQAVKLNEKVLSEANSFIKSNINSSAKPFEPEGYPSVIVVDKKGNTLTEIEPRKDTAYLTEMMSQAGPLAVEAGLNQLDESRNQSPSMLGNKPSLPGKPLTLPHSLSNEKDSNNTSLKITDKESTLLSSLYAVPQNMAQTTLPPQKEEDLEAEDLEERKREKEIGAVVGGSLYHALSQSAYTLAPTAVLLATAATVLPRRSSKKTKKTKKTKRGVRVHRRVKPTRRSTSKRHLKSK